MFGLGSKFFHLRVDPFSEGLWREDMQTGNHNGCFLYDKFCYNLPILSSPLKDIYDFSLIISFTGWNDWRNW